MFTDDTSLYASHRNSQYLNQILQYDLRNISEWFKANSLSLNLEKMFVMQFNNNKDLEKRLELNSKLLPKTYSIKFLGVTVESNLKWSKHVKNLLSKISINKILIGKSCKFLNIQSKKSIYYAHIYSHLSYANTVWSGHLT